jgi:hypothetical protein
MRFQGAHRVVGGGHPPPTPTERSVQICCTTLFGRWFAVLREPAAPCRATAALVAAISLLFVRVLFPWSVFHPFEWMAVSPIAWRPCCLRTTQHPLAASPCGWLSQPRSTISQSDCRRVIGPFSPFGLGGPYKPSLEPDGSPLFTWNLSMACWRYEPRKHLKVLAKARLELLPSPERDKVGYFNHDRFRG